MIKVYVSSFFDGAALHSTSPSREQWNELIEFINTQPECRWDKGLLIMSNTTDLTWMILKWPALSFKIIPDGLSRSKRRAIIYNH